MPNIKVSLPSTQCILGLLTGLLIVKSLYKSPSWLHSSRWNYHLTISWSQSSWSPTFNIINIVNIVTWPSQSSWSPTGLSWWWLASSSSPPPSLSSHYSSGEDLTPTGDWHHSSSLTVSSARNLLRSPWNQLIPEITPNFETIMFLRTFRTTWELLTKSKPIRCKLSSSSSRCLIS